MRTKVTVDEVRVPVAARHAALLKAKLDDLDDYLDALGTVVYDASGAVDHKYGLVLFDATEPRMEMTLVDGTIVNEQTIFKLRSQVTLPAVDIELNVLRAANHNLTTADGPFYLVWNSNPTRPQGLLAHVKYWVIVVDADTLKLALSADAATAGTAVDLITAGTGGGTLTKVRPITSVVFGTDTLTAVGHGYATGDGPVQIVSTLTGPPPLVKSTDYWVISLGADTFKLALSLEDALANTPVNLTGDGTGTLELVELEVITIDEIACTVRITPEHLTGGSAIDLSSLDDRGVLIWRGAAWEDALTDAVAEGGEFTAVGHGLSTGDGPYYFAASVTIPAGLVALTEYWIIATGTDTFQLAASADDAADGVPVTVTSAGAGTRTLTRLVPITTVSPNNDYFTIAGHGLTTGDGPFYVATTVTIPTGLVVLTEYYVIVLDANTIQLASSNGNALAGTFIDLTTNGAGVQSLSKVQTITAAANATEELTVVGHGFTTGDLVRLKGADLPLNLLELTDYYVIVIDVDNFQVATTHQNALDAIEVTFDDDGSGAMKVYALGYKTASAVQKDGDFINKVAHGIADQTKVRIEAQQFGVLPTPLVGATDYWTIVDFGVDTMQLAASAVDAGNNVQIDLADAGSGRLRLLELAFLTITAVDFA